MSLALTQFVSSIEIIILPTLSGFDTCYATDAFTRLRYYSFKDVKLKELRLVILLMQISNIIIFVSTDQNFRDGMK